MSCVNGYQWLSLIVLLIVYSSTPASSSSIDDREFDLARSERVKRIIGGDQLSKGQFPWLVNLRAHIPTKYFLGFAVHYNDVYCGGSLINNRWILTAAHCFYIPSIAQKAILNPKNWYVKSGDTRLSFTVGQRLCAIWNRVEQRHNVNCWYLNVERIIAHPQFVYSDNWKNDIALVKLSSDLQLFPVNQNIDAVKLPATSNLTSWPAPGTNCSVQGWGCTSYDGSLVEIARGVDVPALDDSLCSKTVDSAIGPTRLCAGYKLNSRGLCKGDSGGPLVCRDSHGVWRQAGIASFTSATTPGDVPGVFTRVSEYMDWINRTISSY